MAMEKELFAISPGFAELSAEDFAFFQGLIFRLAGISLSEKKLDLVKSRLRSHIQSLGLRSFSEYRAVLEDIKPNDPEVQGFINLLTTNKTDFFREPQHFDYLINNLIPSWVQRKKKKVKIWCSASSTGEEPYTISMVLQHHLPKDMSYSIDASDIDTEVLAKAKNGVYSEHKFREIPEEYRQYVRQGQGPAAGWFKIGNKTHDAVQFFQHNLVVDPLNNEEPYDLIFCRNVLIYFSPDTIRTLAGKLHRALDKNGLLFIGHSESLHGGNSLFKTLQPSVFKKV